MGDLAETFQAMNKEKKERHKKWYKENLQILKDSGLEFDVRKTSILIRIPNKPKIDFYPHTGRWRIVGSNKTKTLRGGASAFLKWFNKY